MSMARELGTILLNLSLLPPFLYFIQLLLALCLPTYIPPPGVALALWDWLRWRYHHARTVFLVEAGPCLIIEPI